MSGASERVGLWVEDKALSIAADTGFKVENILVEDRRFTDVDALMAIINIEKGDSLFSFKPDSARDMIQKLSWVKSAQVERRLPDTIYIGLTERVPMALWQRHKRLSLIDTDGVILTDHKLERFKDLVIVVGKEIPSKAPDFLKLLEAEPIIRSRVEAATLISNRRWDLTLESGAVVKLPEKGTVLALRRLAAMQKDEGLLDKNVKVIDVRELSRITVRTKPGAVHEYKADYKNNSHVGGAI